MEQSGYNLLSFEVRLCGWGFMALTARAGVHRGWSRDHGLDTGWMLENWLSISGKATTQQAALQKVSCDQVSDSLCLLLAGVGAKASASADTLQQLQVVLHLLSPEGSPAFEARTVSVKAGRWYARGLTGAADVAAAGAGGTAEVSRFRLSIHPAPPCTSHFCGGAVNTCLHGRSK